MRTPTSSIAMFLAAALLGAVGQYFYKSGANRAGAGWTSYLNWRLGVGVGCYVGVMALFVAAFRRGGELSVLYPLYASTFVWGALIAWWAYGEPVTWANAGGMALLVAGMWLMGR